MHAPSAVEPLGSGCAARVSQMSEKAIGCALFSSDDHNQARGTHATEPTLTHHVLSVHLVKNTLWYPMDRGGLGILATARLAGVHTQLHMCRSMQTMDREDPGI